MPDLLAQIDALGERLCAYAGEPWPERRWQHAFARLRAVLEGEGDGS